MHLFVCNLNVYGCFELHTEPEKVVNKISVIFSFQSWQVWFMCESESITISAHVEIEYAKKDLSCSFRNIERVENNPWNILLSSGAFFTRNWFLNVFSQTHPRCYPSSLHPFFFLFRLHLTLEGSKDQVGIWIPSVDPARRKTWLNHWPYSSVATWL